MEDHSFDDEYYSLGEKERLEKPKLPVGDAPHKVLETGLKWQRGALLGSGSFGKVYLGLNLDSGELIAVKQVELVGDVTMHVSELAALQHEISVMRTLNNENIVRYLGSSIEENVFNIFLEYVPGGSIASLIRKFSKLNEKIIRLYTKQILMGLEYLHSHQIIHRDIKGANILVDNKGIIKLADFGASRRLEGLFAQTGEGCRSLKGTIFWMAPEVIKQEGYGRQADIWSLGCTVLEMATGTPPWSSRFADQVSAMFNIATTEDPPPMPDDLSDEAKDFLLHCFKRNPKERPNATRLLQHPFVVYSDPKRKIAHPLRASERSESDDESDESDAELEYSYNTALQRSVNARSNQQYPDTRPKNISKSANWVSDDESDDSTDEDLSQVITHFKDSHDNHSWYQQSATPAKYLGNKLSRSSTRRRRFKSDTYTPQELYDSRTYSRNFKTTRMHEMEDDESDYHSSFEAPPVHYNHSKQYRPSAENSLNSSQEDNSAPSPSVSLTKKTVVAPILGTSVNVLLPTIHELPTPKTTPKESASRPQRANEGMDIHHHGSLLVDSDDSDSEEFESSKLQQLVHRLNSDEASDDDDDDVDPRVLRHSAMLDSSESDSDSSDNTSARSFGITPSEKQLRASGSSITRSGAKRRTIVIRTSQNIVAPQPAPPVPDLLVAPVTEQLRGLRVSSSITDSDDEHWDPYKADLR